MTRVTIAQIQGLIDSGDFFAAEQMSLALVKTKPDVIEGWMLLILCTQRLRHFELMKVAALHAVQLQPNNLTLCFKYVETLLFCGDGPIARQQLKELEASSQHDAKCLSRISALYSEAGEHMDRLRCARRALQLLPGNHALLADVAAAETACGDMQSAENHLNELLWCFPQDHGACYRLSTLRRQTLNNNHVRELEERLTHVSPHATEVVPLCYALAKELEDLGDFEKSFHYLKRGADQRRRQLSYSVSEDEQAIAEIIEQYDSALLNQPCSGYDDTSAIFVMGLPRSGTTLVDRILSSHSAVQSLGEINDLAYCIVRLAHLNSDHALNKLELIGVSSRLDFKSVGAEYIRSAQGHGLNKRMFIDKTPWNFLYLGLIAMSLPNAKIIHVKRHPMDSCYALYKTLFRGGSPYSYDFDDLARYYIAYHHLMQHWRKCLPERFFEVQYEELVKSQEVVTREMLYYCGLDFEIECLEFHRNTQPAATASAAQVREPIHSRSVAGWKNYLKQLTPLMERLREAGIEID